MTTMNVTKRASKAMYELSKAHEKIVFLLNVVSGEENLRVILDACDLIDKAQIELVKILAQDNQIELSLE